MCRTLAMYCVDSVRYALQANRVRVRGAGRLLPVQDAQGATYTLASGTLSNAIRIADDWILVITPESISSAVEEQDREEENRKVEVSDETLV